MGPNIKAGLAAESNCEVELVSLLVEKIVDHFDFEILFKITDTKNPGSSLLGHIKEYIRHFVETKQDDIVIFITDQDKNPEARGRVIADIRLVDPSYLEFTALGICIPHFESWILADEDNVKKVFGLPADKSLPYSNLEPKDQCASIRSASAINLSHRAAASALIDGCRLNILESKCKDYSNFVSDLRKKLNQAIMRKGGPVWSGGPWS